MKRIGILLASMTLCAFTMMAQDNSASSSTSTDTTAAPNSTTTTSTTTTTTSHDRDAAQDQAEQTNRDAHKQRAVRDENAATAEKDAAKNSGTKAGEEHDKAIARLDDASKVLNQLLATPDKGIPSEVFDKAKCVAVVPSMVKGGFIFGAEHGRGVATCRNGRDWSAPAFIALTGGSWGAQIGGEAMDVVMLIMNDNGMNQLLNSKFKIGAGVSGAAGPVGREASASTDWKMRSEVLTYSRSRGAFIGATLNGVAIHEDENATTAFYGRPEAFRSILTGQVKPPAESERFLATVRRAHAETSAKKD